VVADVEGGRSIPLGKKQTHSRAQAVVVAEEGGMEVLPWHFPRIFAGNSMALSEETVHILMALLVETGHVVVGCSMEARQAHLLSPFQNLIGSDLMIGWCSAMRRCLLGFRLMDAVMTSVGCSMRESLTKFFIRQRARSRDHFHMVEE